MNKKKIKILWTHTFDPEVLGSGNFMYNFHKNILLDDLDINFLYLGKLSNPINIIKAVLALKKCENDYDLIHSQFGSLCGFISSFSSRKKIISLRGSDWHLYKGNDFKEKIHGYLARFLTYISINKFDEIIVMSNKMRNEVMMHFSRANVSVITDPIDTEIFKPIDRDIARTSFFNSTSKSPWILLTTLSLNNSIKRIELATQAVEIAKISFPDLELKIATNISHRDMPYFVSSCNLALCTSTHEGWPNFIKEALACGIPFVSTDVSDLSFIAENYESCFIAEDTPIKLAESIVKSLSLSNREDLSNAVKGFSIPITVEKIVNVYKSLIK